MIRNRVSSKLHRDLVFALESARMRLAVAIAAETKSTPPDRLRHCMETVDRARKIMKKLRRENFDIVQERREWIDALESLKHLPVQSEATPLCRLLREIVTQLE